MIKMPQRLIGLTISIMLALSPVNFVNVAVAQEFSFAPPLFSSAINSIFPSAPFVTCLQGQFQPLLPPPQPLPAHVWFVKAQATGQLSIDVRAVSVNNTEAGSVIANLFDPTLPPPPPPTPIPPASSVQVFYPTGVLASPGDENVGFLNYAVTAGTIYRLEILLGSPPVTNPPTAQAHHYKLSFSGVEVDVGVTSPTFSYFEHNLPYEVFQVNLNQGEDFDLHILTENPNQGANQATTVTLEILERVTLTPLLGPTAFSLPPLNPPPSSSSVIVSLPAPFPNSSGQLVLKVSADGHYRLNKTSGTDHGVYFDTCLPVTPPPPPPPAEEARTIGYWKNHPEDTSAQLPQTLGTYLVSDLDLAFAILASAQAKNALDMLAAQLLASKLNVTDNVPSGCIVSAISDADSILAASGFNGPGSTVAPTGSDKQAVNAVKDKLDSFNNNGCL